MNLDNIMSQDIICIYDCCVFRLQYEDKGYIFRQLLDSKFGATGHHPSKEIAIRDVQTKGCQVFINIKSLT